MTKLRKLCLVAVLASTVGILSAAQKPAAATYFPLKSCAPGLISCYCGTVLAGCAYTSCDGFCS